jgi:hypothetical protein
MLIFFGCDRESDSSTTQSPLVRSRQPIFLYGKALTVVGVEPASSNENAIETLGYSFPPISTYG